MNRYRSNENGSALQAQNLSNNGQQNYCQYFELTGRIGTRGRTLYQPDSADVALLQQIALSGTGVAFKACRLLQFYQLGANCGTGLTRIYLPAQPQAKSAVTEKWLGQSYPNPTTGWATIPYLLPEGANRATIELRELVTGRIVGSYNLPAQAGQAQLEVALDMLVSGNYVYTLMVDNVSMGTGKMVVIK